MKNLIGISGKKQTGKDSFFQVVKNTNPDFENKKFADKLKEICAMLTGLPLEYFYEHKYYGTVLDGWNMTIREFQQKIGTEAMRNGLHPDAWVYALFANFNDTSKWIITDVRFPNEVNEIKKRGGLIIRINRDLNSNDTHLSETALDNYTDWDYIIDNNSSLEDYQKIVAEVFSEILSA